MLEFEKNTNPDIELDSSLNFELSDASVNDVVRMLIEEAGRYPLLTKKQEFSLAEEIDIANQNGNKEEKDFYFNKFVNHNLRFPIHHAKRYREKGVDFEDLIQEGNIGLLRAVNNFDYKKGFRFSTYAKWPIKRAITYGLAQQGRNIYLPEHILEEIKDLSDTTQQIEQDLCREARVEDLVACTGKSVEEINYIKLVSQKVESLNEIINEDGNEKGDFISDDASLEDQVIDPLSIHQEVDELMNKLDEREVKIFIMRYGLGSDIDCTAKEVGEALGISRQRVNVIENDAMKKLQSGTCIFNPSSELVS